VISFSCLMFCCDLVGCFVETKSLKMTFLRLILVAYCSCVRRSKIFENVCAKIYHKKMSLLVKYML